uniref:MARVEL domain-containing protein n=1 Tax=Rhabditophanes sp. KR3021 TaxID=114890 RepID=A0AC35U3R5_9BILA
MDFSPDADKWSCCCCRLHQGIQILGFIEIATFLFIAIATAYQMVMENDSPLLSETIFDYCFIFVILFSALSSFLMIVALRKNKKNLLYPTIIARVCLILFIQVFGVSKVVIKNDNVVNEYESQLIPTTYMYNQKSANFNNKYKLTKAGANHWHATKFVIYVFISFFITIALIYSIYHIIRAKKYINGQNKLQKRRTSQINAGIISDMMILEHYVNEKRKAELSRQNSENSMVEQIEEASYQ